ncbi:MAG: hypothetical protein WDO19_09440 [Bacteroidota bacterium]
MATKQIKTIISKHFVTSFNMSRRSVEYVVEAKPRRSWIRVGGPFSDQTEANNFADEYSSAHRDVEVQVVIFQS